MSHAFLIYIMFGTDMNLYLIMIHECKGITLQYIVQQIQILVDRVKKLFKFTVTVAIKICKFTVTVKKLVELTSPYFLGILGCEL